MHKMFLNLFLISLFLISCAPKNIEVNENDMGVEIILSLNIWKNKMPMVNGTEDNVIAVFEGGIKFLERVEKAEVIFVGIYNEENVLLSEIELDSTLIFINPDNFESFSMRGEAISPSEIQTDIMIVGSMIFVIDGDTIKIETEKVEVKAAY